MEQTPLDARWAGPCDDKTPRDRRNLWRANGILFVWMTCLLGSTFLIRSKIVADGPLGWALAVLPSIAGVFAVVAFARFLDQTDDLQRAIHLQALAIGMGAAFVAWPSYRLFERLGVSVDDWPDVAVLIAVFYMFGILYARWRYR